MLFDVAAVLEVTGGDRLGSAYQEAAKSIESYPVEVRDLGAWNLVMLPSRESNCRLFDEFF